MTGLIALATRLGDTPGSVALRESLWTYPAIETMHVLAISVFVGFAALLDLRLLGVALSRTPVSAVVERLMPWTWRGFAVMVATGALLFYADPARFLGNVFFQIKLGLLIVAGANAAVFHTTVYRRVAAWNVDPGPPLAARLAGALSLVVWSAVVVTGRLIAYDWF